MTCWWLAGLLPIRQVRMKIYLPSRKIYLSQITGQHFFCALPRENRTYSMSPWRATRLDYKLNLTNQFMLLISLLFLVVREFSIQDLLTSASTTLILLRHFAWLPWRDHVAQVQSRKAEFEALNGEVIVVSFGNVVSRSCVIGILCIVYSLINTPPS